MSNWDDDAKDPIDCIKDEIERIENRTYEDLYSECPNCGEYSRYTLIVPIGHYDTCEHCYMDEVMDQLGLSEEEKEKAIEDMFEEDT